jgi:hypothetical protein
LAGDKRSEVRTRHNTRFDPEKVGAELAGIAQGFKTFKSMGDAMASHHMAKDDIAAFFKAALDIPFDAKKEDISTRKVNQYSDLSTAYGKSVSEGAPKETVWAALQAVTRYVDHERTTRGGASEDEARVLSSQYGSGSAFKSKALALLFPLVQDKVLIPA